MGSFHNEYKGLVARRMYNCCNGVQIFSKCDGWERGEYNNMIHVLDAATEEELLKVMGYETKAIMIVGSNQKNLRELLEALAARTEEELTKDVIIPAKEAVPPRPNYRPGCDCRECQLLIAGKPAEPERIERHRDAEKLQAIDLGVWQKAINPSHIWMIRRD